MNGILTRARDFWRRSRKSVLTALGTATTAWAVSGVFDWKAIVSAVVLAFVVYWTRNDPPGEGDALPT